jgi:hypothetical protein
VSPGPSTELTSVPEQTDRVFTVRSGPRGYTLRRSRRRAASRQRHDTLLAINSRQWGRGPGASCMPEKVRSQSLSLRRRSKYLKPVGFLARLPDSIGLSGALREAKTASYIRDDSTLN